MISPLGPFPTTMVYSRSSQVKDKKKGAGLAPLTVIRGLSRIFVPFLAGLLDPDSKGQDQGRKCPFVEPMFQGQMKGGARNRPRD